ADQPFGRRLLLRIGDLHDLAVPGGRQGEPGADDADDESSCDCHRAPPAAAAAGGFGSEITTVRFAGVRESLATRCTSAALNFANRSQRVLTPRGSRKKFE